MSYATTADLELRLGHSTYVLLTDDGGTGEADEAKAIEALGAAEGEVNSYLSRRCSVPVDVVAHAELAAVLRGVTLDLAEYRLQARRPPVPDDVRRKRDSAVEWLQKVVRGEAMLPAAGEPAGNTTAGPVGAWSGSVRVMSREELGGL